MPQVIFIDHNGIKHHTYAQTGQSLLSLAQENGLLIEQDCNGQCACTACHVYMDTDWEDIVGIACAQEKKILLTAAIPQSNSRLACQIQVTDELDGLTVILPSCEI